MDKGCENLAHANIYLSRKKKPKKSWCLSLQENLPDCRLCKVSKGDEKMKWHAFLSSLDKIVSTPLGKAYTYFADVNLWKFLLSHQIAVLIYLTLEDTHFSLASQTLSIPQHQSLSVCGAKLYKKMKSSFDPEDEKLWTWAIEVKMSCSSFAKPSYRNIATTFKMLADLLSQTRTLHLFTNTVFMLVVNLWQSTVCKLEKGLITLQQSNCRCSTMLPGPSSLLLTYHAATDKLSKIDINWQVVSKKGLLTALVRYSWAMHAGSICIFHNIFGCCCYVCKRFREFW